MALPLSRSKTFVAGVSEIEADEMNDLEDSVIQRSHGSINQWFPISSAGTMNETESGINGGWVTPSVPTVEINLPQGTTITAVTTYVVPDGTTAITGQLVKRVVSTGVTTAIETVWTTSTAATRQAMASASLPHTIAADETVYMSIIPAHADAAAHGCLVTYYKPIV